VIYLFFTITYQNYILKTLISPAPLLVSNIGHKGNFMYLRGISIKKEIFVYSMGHIENSFFKEAYEGGLIRHFGVEKDYNFA